MCASIRSENQIQMSKLLEACFCLQAVSDLNSAVSYGFPILTYQLMHKKPITLLNDHMVFSSALLAENTKQQYLLGFWNVTIVNNL